MKSTVFGGLLSLAIGAFLLYPFLGETGLYPAEVVWAVLALGYGYLGLGVALVGSASLSIFKS